MPFWGQGSATSRRIIDGNLSHLPRSIGGRLGVAEGSRPPAHRRPQCLYSDIYRTGRTGSPCETDVDLETRIEVIEGLIECEDLSNIILVGHSYGGMVASGVADQIPERIGHLIYLDAFVPVDDQSLYDLAGESSFTAPIDGWVIQPIPSAPDTSVKDLAWTMPGRRHQPVRCFSQKLRLTHATPSCSRSHIHCTKKVGRTSFCNSPAGFATTPPGASTRWTRATAPTLPSLVC